MSKPATKPPSRSSKPRPPPAPPKHMSRPTVRQVTELQGLLREANVDRLRAILARDRAETRLLRIALLCLAAGLAVGGVAMFGILAVGG